MAQQNKGLPQPWQRHASLSRCLAAARTMWRRDGVGGAVQQYASDRRVQPLAVKTLAACPYCRPFLFLRCKTRMQSLQPEPNAQYRGVYEALKRIIRTEGLFRPLRGLNITMMGAGPAHALYFACYERVKRSLSDIIRSGGNSNLANGTRARASNQQTVTLCALHTGPRQLGPRAPGPLIDGMLYFKAVSCLQWPE